MVDCEDRHDDPRPSVRGLVMVSPLGLEPGTP
jgi:hypothetical protein